MESVTIEELLERYYNGDTTLAEERQLAELFARRDVPPYLEQERQIYLFYAAARQEQTTVSIDEELLKANREPGKVMALRRVSIWPALAASIVIMIGAGMYFSNTAVKKGNIYGTYSNPELAYAETQRALLLISEKLNKGTRQLDKLAELDRVEHLLNNKKTEQ